MDNFEDHKKEEFTEFNVDVDSTTEKQKAFKKLKDEFEQNMERERTRFAKISGATANHVQIQKKISELLNNMTLVYMDGDGGTVILEVRGNIVKARTINWLASNLAPILVNKNIHLSAKNLREHIKTWIDSKPKIEKLPPSFSFNSHELTFNHISFGPISGASPTWDIFIANCGDNGEALMAFIWSLLTIGDKGQQYLFIKGNGRDGKGSLIRWLNKLFNNDLVALSASDSYWPAMCVGKRLGVFNDINNTAIIMSSYFKQITGGDKVSIQQKYEKSFAANLETKLILTTNLSINITGSNADRRRAILVEVKTANQHIRNYEEKLFEETSAFLFKCKLAYEKLHVPERNIIECDYSFFEAEAENFEERYEALLARSFSLSSKSTIAASDFYNRLTSQGADASTIGRFKEWLHRNHGIQKKKASTGNRANQYVGLSLKVGK